MARFSAWPCTVTFVDDEIVPFSSARVCPETFALGSITLIAAAPMLTPGAFAKATLVESATIEASPPVIPMLPPVITASVERLLSAFVIVRPPAATPVLTLKLSARTPPCRPVAVSERPSEPSGPCAPEAARVVPARVENATAPLMLPPMPTCTE